MFIPSVYVLSLIVSFCGLGNGIISRLPHLYMKLNAGVNLVVLLRQICMGFHDWGDVDVQIYNYGPSKDECTAQEITSLNDVSIDCANDNHERVVAEYELDTNYPSSSPVEGTTEVVPHAGGHVLGGVKDGRSSCANLLLLQRSARESSRYFLNTNSNLVQAPSGLHTLFQSTKMPYGQSRARNPDLAAAV